jgi:hypothetical protein
LVSVSEGTLDIPTYEHTGRELEPLLFESSTVKGLYPFPSYLAQFQDDSPKVKTYRTILVENEYLKLTYIPELGGRFFSLYDKVRKKEVFYRNDVIKPTMFNPGLIGHNPASNSPGLTIPTPLRSMESHSGPIPLCDTPTAAFLWCWENWTPSITRR